MSNNFTLIRYKKFVHELLHRGPVFLRLTDVHRLMVSTAVCIVKWDVFIFPSFFLYHAFREKLAAIVTSVTQPTT